MSTAYRIESVHRDGQAVVLGDFADRTWEDRDSLLHDAHKAFHASTEPGVVLIKLAQRDVERIDAWREIRGRIPLVRNLYWQYRRRKR